MAALSVQNTIPKTLADLERSLPDVAPEELVPILTALECARSKVYGRLIHEFCLSAQQARHQFPEANPTPNAEEGVKTYLRADEVAKRFGISKRTVYKNKDQLGAVKLPGSRSLLFDAAKLTQALEPQEPWRD